MIAPGYEGYRESGVRHIGDLPTHWSLVALKRVATFTYGDALAADVRGEGDIKVFGSNGPVGTHSAPNTSAPVVFVGRKGSCGALTWSDAAGFAIDTVYYVDPSCCRADLRWLYWTLHTLGLENSSQDTGVPGLSREVAHSSPVPLPPPAEQAAIAAFLDRETGKIDALVEAQTRLIELLKEKRQAVVSRAVTKGLDPAAPMKDSGVEWLGRVPAHWEVVAIKRLARLQSGDAITSSGIEEVGTFPVYGGNGLRGFTESYTHDGDFVLIGRQGALCGNINYAQGRFWASEHAIVAHPLQPFVIRWFGELLRTMNLGQYSVAAAQPGLSADALSNLRCPHPPIEEQAAIVQALDQQLGNFGGLIAEAERAIALLQERRAALISAAVAGKIDVRGLVPQQAEAA